MKKVNNVERFYICGDNTAAVCLICSLEEQHEAV